MAKYSRQIKNYDGKQAVHPIKDKRQLDDFMNYWLLKVETAKSAKKYYLARRNWLLSLLGINTAFRAEDLLQLRVKDVIKGYFSIVENKTKKIQNYKMNKKVHQAILEYVKEFNLTSTMYLFMGQKKKDKMPDGTVFKVINPITRQQFHNLMQQVAEAININFKFGPHSLRKTYAYHFYKNGGSIITLMKMLNHDNTAYTLLYIEWDEYDVQKNREEFCLGV